MIPDPDAGIASIIAALIVNGRARDALELTERGRARELLLAFPYRDGRATRPLVT